MPAIASVHSIPADGGRPGRTAALGSLAAVAAWSAASRSSAAPIISTTVVNVPVTNGSTLDIDGSGNTDFTFLFNNSQVVRLTGAGSNGSAASTQIDGFGQYSYSKVLTSGSTVDSSLSYLATTTVAESGFPAPSSLGSFVVGVRFTGTDSQPHYGWVSFNFPSNTTPWTGAVATSAGWETTPNTAISVVPEPMVGVVGVAVVVACLGRHLLRMKRFTR